MFGELHPHVAAAWDFDEPVAVFAIDVGKADRRRARGRRPTRTSRRIPELRQDLAVDRRRRRSRGDASWTSCARPAASCSPAPRSSTSTAASRSGEGRVSLALHLEFRAADRTLTDEDVAPVREKIVAALRDELGGELRG